MKEIQLGGQTEKVALVDDEDFGLASCHKWHLWENKDHGICYATSDAVENGKRKIIYMHRLILGLKDRKTYCDHINHDGLDNRRSNLRPCSQSQNMANVGSVKSNTSGYKGVCFTHRRYKNGRVKERQNPWMATITYAGKLRHLGRYATAEMAHNAYCCAAYLLFGEFSSVAQRG